MKYLSIFLLTFFVASACNSQTNESKQTDANKVTNNANSYSVTIKTQANEMAALLLKKDYTAFSKFTYPKIEKMMGGKEGMINMMNKEMESMKAEGYAFINVTIGEPGPIIKSGNELQCTVPEKIEMKVPGGRIVSNTTLIAISVDGGKNWYFVDTSGKDINAMKNILPGLSKNLVISGKEKPSFFAD